MSFIAQHPRSRILYAALIVLVIATGLASRKYPDLLPAELGKYPGDGLWALGIDGFLITGLLQAHVVYRYSGNHCAGRLLYGGVQPDVPSTVDRRHSPNDVGASGVGVHLSCTRLDRLRCGHSIRGGLRMVLVASI